MHYSLKVIDKPAIEPLTLEEVKLHLRIDHCEENEAGPEDTFLDALITAAREYCEDVQNRAYIERTYLLSFDGIPTFPIELPKPPLKSVEKIEYKKGNGTTEEWDGSNYFIYADRVPGRIMVASDGAIPDDKDIYSFQIQYKAGEEKASDVREGVKVAMKMLIGHWYENREAWVIGTIASEIKMAVNAILGHDRMWPV